MTPADRALAEAMAQGLPPLVTDVAVLRRVAGLVVEAKAPAPAAAQCAGCPGKVAA